MSKGTFSNIISDAYKNVISDKKRFSENITLDQHKNIHFSVFERTEDINDLQKKFVGIKTSVHSLFDSYTNFGNCYFCNDKIFVSSQKYCKICKLNYSKRYSVSLNCEKNLKCKSAVTNNNIISKCHSAKTTLSSSTQISLHREKNSCQKSSMSALERRQRSLSRALKKIHKPSVSHN